ncbi:MAG: RpiB/LacA/LacB family sugar-phosphate isomerase [Candidatus Vogelbacteria bacterium]|nr:RpiB/LacA/LacB family sugar-phosphate isomerase [Candidatus Vogelbacteria bacterium]
MLNKRKIYIASDHAGFELKGKLINYLQERGYAVEDMGAYTYDEKDDYPEFISRAAEAVSKDPQNSLGIVLGGSGEGEAMVADRYPNVRAAIYYGGPMSIVKLSREHNDANILSLGARFIAEDQAREAVKLWLETPFSGDERHVRRIKEIEDLKTK